MAKEEKKQEQGVEATPTLLDNTVLQQVADLEAKVKVLESIIEDKEVKISELETKVKDQEVVIEQQGVEAVRMGDLIAELEVGNAAVAVVPGENEVVIRFLLSPAGKFKLPYNVGQEVSLHEELAAEIVESRYAEYVK